MPFPKAKKVVYHKNPLDRVICQFKFPPILKIETEIPAEFQERIRNEFPGFIEKRESTLSVPERIKQEDPIGMFQQIIPSENKNYKFVSEDELWYVNLTRTFMALTSKKYERREQFKKKLQEPFKALIEIYKPSYFSRIGLRYIDIIKRSALKLEGIDWKDLLQPYVLGFLGSSDINKDIQSLEAKYEIRLDDGRSMARIVMSLIELGDEKPEECFMIDTDFSNSDKTKPLEAEKILDYLHVQASQLMQWLITGRLHEAMEPEIIS